MEGGHEPVLSHGPSTSHFGSDEMQNVGVLLHAIDRVDVLLLHPAVSVLMGEHLHCHDLLTHLGTPHLTEAALSCYLQVLYQL